MRTMAFYFDKIILLVISIFILVVPYSSYFSKRCIYLAIFLWIIKFLVDYKNKIYEKLPSIENVDKILFVFFGVAVLATVFGLNPYHSQSVLFERYLIYIIMYFLGVVLCKEKKNVLFLMGVLFVVSGILAIGGLHDYIMNRPARLFTVFNKGIELQVYLIFSIPIIFAVCFFSNNKIWKSVSLIMGSVLFLNLVFSGSRGALIAVIISFSVIIFFLKSKSIKFILFFINICLCIFILFFMPTNYSIIKNRASIDERVRLFSSSISIFKDYPILGSGPGMYEKLLYKYQPTGGYADGGGHLHTHNTYLEVAAEMGIIGLMVFLAIFILYFRKTFKSIKMIKDNNIRAIQIGLMGAIIANLMYAMSCTIITVGIQEAVLFWLLFGVSCGIMRDTEGWRRDKRISNVRMN